MACLAKLKTAGKGATAQGGILFNHSYCILSCRQLQNGTRLIKLHNPWEGGSWTGPWSWGSSEWSQEEHAGLKEESALIQDDSAFWMSYRSAIGPAAAAHAARAFIRA